MFWACLGVGVFALGLVVVFGHQVLADSSLTWHHLGPLSASTLTLVSTFIYFIRWNDQWSHLAAVMAELGDGIWQSAGVRG